MENGPWTGPPFSAGREPLIAKLIVCQNFIKNPNELKNLCNVIFQLYVIFR